MTYRFYGSIVIGTGTIKDPFRPKVEIYLAPLGKQFWNWLNPVFSWQVCLTECSNATHTQLAADVDIIPMSPQFADFAAIDTWLDQVAGTIPSTLVTKLETNGFPMDWINSNTTNRQIWRRLSRYMVICQITNGKKDSVVLDFLRNNLSSTVASLPANVRNRAQAWMTENNFDTSWIVGTTTIREVVNFICDSVTQTISLGIDL